MCSCAAQTDSIELVGTVPDDVATVDIAGALINVSNNVWHFTTPAGSDLTSMVRSSDGARSASLGR